jgi:hypothetical protein
LPDDRDSPVEDRRTSLERILAKAREGGPGQPLSRRTRQTRRTLEAYLRAGFRPRWMERVMEIDGAIAMEKRRLERAYRAHQEDCGHDATLFATRWSAHAHSCRFEALNDLIRQHNEWYPVERDLPMDPRTRDYVLVRGRSYRRTELGPEWVLEHFPPVPAAGADRPRRDP